MSYLFAVVFISAYMIPAIYAVVLTFMEGEESSPSWDFARVIGLLLCLVWPIVAAAAISYSIYAYFARQADSAAQNSAVRSSKAPVAPILFR